MIGSTNARTSKYPRNWNVVERDYLAGESIEKDSPIAVAHRFNNMEQMNIFSDTSETIATTYNYSSVISSDGKYIVNPTGTSNVRIKIFKRNSSGTYDRIDDSAITSGTSDTLRSATFISEDTFLVSSNDSTESMKAFKLSDSGITKIPIGTILDAIPTGMVLRAKTSLDHSILALGGSNFFYLYRKVDGKYMRIGTNISLTSGVVDLDISPDNNYLLYIIGSGNQFRLFKISEDDTLSTVSINNSSLVSLTAGAFLNNESLIVCSSTTSVTFKIMSDLQADRVKEYNVGSVLSYTISRDGRYLYLCTSTLLRIYSIDALYNLVEVPTNPAFGNSHHVLETMNDELIVVSSSGVKGYKMKYEAFNVSPDREFTGSIEAIGYALENKSEGETIRAAILPSFNIMNKIS